jgi:hypothetical protein
LFHVNRTFADELLPLITINRDHFGAVVLSSIDLHSFAKHGTVNPMADKKIKTESPRAILAAVKKEMALPRICKSAREALARG